MTVIFRAHTDIDDTDVQVEIQYWTADSIYSSPEDLLARKVYDATAEIIDVICKDMGISHQKTYKKLATYFEEAEYDRD